MRGSLGSQVHRVFGVRAGRFLMLMVVGAMAAACGGEDETDQGLLPGDGGVDRPGPDDGGDTPDTGTPDLPSGWDGVTSNLEVTIVSPGTNQAWRRSEKFAPHVEVQITSSGGVQDLVDEVTAVVLSSPTKEEVKKTLNQTDKRTDGSAEVYVFTETPLDISKLESGNYQLRVTAKTVGGSIAQSTIPFKIDVGPKITILSPEPNSYHKGSLLVRARVTDVADFLPIAEVVMTVGSKPPLTVTPADASGVYTASLDFNAYKPELDGQQLIRVTAKNSNGTTATATVVFTVDRLGPFIVNTIPAVGELIGGVIVVQAEIADGAGVLDSSVKAVIAHGPQQFHIPLDKTVTSGKAIYHSRFDTSLLPAHFLSPSISFRASDLLGNENTVGYLVSLDNTPPLSDLDPPAKVRMRKKEQDAWRCSWPFDPVGPDAVDDGQMVTQLFDIRARIEDQGNTPISGSTDYVPIAGVDVGDVKLALLDDTTQALVVDGSGDGKCDRLNPNLRPTTVPQTSSEILLLDMTPIAPTGSADFTPDMSLSGSAQCTMGTATKIPDPFCPTTGNWAKGEWDPWAMTFHSDEMTVAMSYTTGKMPSIWTLAPIIQDRLQCAGRQLDSAASFLNEGWVCLAVVASDSLGNTQVSRPIRVCIDHGNGATVCPHVKIASTTGSGTTPIRVTTATPHGLSTGDQVVIHGVWNQVVANGTWTVTRIDNTTISLNGSAPIAELGAGGGDEAYLVPVSAMPNCTGTLVSAGPPAQIDATQTCSPWRSYLPLEIQTQL